MVNGTKNHKINGIQCGKLYPNGGTIACLIVNGSCVNGEYHKINGTMM